VLCPGLRVLLTDEISGDKDEWCYDNGIPDYLSAAVKGFDTLPETPLNDSMESRSEAADWALFWLPEGGDPVHESYVNLVPTAQGGTHVNGLRSGVTEAVRGFAEVRNLIPRGVRITPEDVWESVSYVLSVKLADPQFSGQTKERLSSRECAMFVSGIVKDSLAQWLNQHPETGDQIALMVINQAQKRMRAGKKVKSAYSPMPILTARTSRHYCAPCFCDIFVRWLRPGMCTSLCRRCFASMSVRRCFMLSMTLSAKVFWIG